MTRFRDRPWYHLTEHFFRGLFDLGFLSEAGVDSFTRMVVGSCTVFFSFGLLILRVFASRRGPLRSPEVYRLTILANHAFLIAVPMWIVGFVTVLVSHALFPDETDFRVLMALPVPRRVIFGAKLLALALFALLFTLAAHIALLPLSILMSMGLFVGVPFPVQFIAYLVGSLLGSVFAVMAVVAIQGLLILSAPRGGLLTVSAVLRSAFLCAMVIALPLVMRLPGLAPHFAAGSTWLYFAPPVWFMGVERWLMGDVSRHYFGAMARIGAVGLAAAAALAAGSYVFLYRRFDRVLLMPAHGSARDRRRIAWRRWIPRAGRRPILTAVRSFTLITLRRSVLHQGILVGLSAAGGGLVINSLLSAEGRAFAASTVWAPFALMFVASLAVRMAIAVPIEPRANWVFRMTEDDASRVDQLEGAVRTVRLLGVVVPLMLLAPLEVAGLGPLRAAGALAIALLCGWFLVEILMKQWTRIPFTCSYIPGKGFVPQTILTGFTTFVAFTTIGSALARSSFSGHAFPLAIDLIVLAATLMLRRQRLRLWRDTPLAFEDVLPSEVSPLRLSVD